MNRKPRSNPKNYQQIHIDDFNRLRDPKPIIDNTLKSGRTIFLEVRERRQHQPIVALFDESGNLNPKGKRIGVAVTLAEYRQMRKNRQYPTVIYRGYGDGSPQSEILFIARRRKQDAHLLTEAKKSTRAILRNGING